MKTGIHVDGRTQIISYPKGKIWVEFDNALSKSKWVGSSFARLGHFRSDSLRLTIWGKPKVAQLRLQRKESLPSKEGVFGRISAYP